MNFTDSKISQFIEQQLPDFILEEFPKFVSFFKEYYKSLEISSGVLDVSNNILEYLDLDNLTKNNVVSGSILSNSISSTDTEIVLDSVNGFELQNGIILIDDEIIFYQGVNLSTNTLLNCKRGYSATTELKQIGTTIDSSESASHAAGAKVRNLSNLILFTLIQNYEDQYLEGFPHTEILSEVDTINLVKNIKDFYSSKGTESSFKFLFRVLFNEEIELKFPRDQVLKVSESDWSVDDILKVEVVKGDPYDLVGQQLYQVDFSGAVSAVAVIDSILVNNVTSFRSKTKLIYELRLKILERPDFYLPSRTFLRRNLTTTDTTIIVDSTIGFPETGGRVRINDEIITYKYKTFNQFVECLRGTSNTVASSHTVDDEVLTSEILFGYKNGIVSEENKVEIRITPVISDVRIEDGSSYYEFQDIFDISQNGVSDDREIFTGWLINESGISGNSADTNVQSIIKDFTVDVTAVYKTDNYVYVASNGIPNHGIGPFKSVNGSIGNQALLKSIPLNQTQNFEIRDVGEKTIGIFNNGVEAFSSKSGSKKVFGEIVSVDVVNSGYGWRDNVNPVCRVTGNGSGAVLKANVLNGTINSVTVINGGSDFTEDPDIEISYGFDAKASILNDNDISSGAIKNISVTDPGNNYVFPPDVIITDITGKGKGAYAIANIANGEVTSITVLNGGLDYTNKSNISISLVSQGKGCVLRANVRRWNFDRNFLATHSENLSTGEWVSTQRKTDQGNGYLYQSLDGSKGLQYGYAINPKKFRARLFDNVKSASSDFNEIDSGFVHSPILGWAYDGSPIYGPYGYSDPQNPSSQIKRMESSYALATSLANRPSQALYPLGSFVEDYEFDFQSGDLDEYNGRFCKTPEYPDGIYAYFITVNSVGDGIFPYIIGNSYKYAPAENNFLINHSQKETYLPSDAKRLRTSKTPNFGYDLKLYVNDTERGSIDSYIVNDTQSIFKVNDYLFVDSTETEGAGAIAQVEDIYGVTVSSLTYSVASGFSASGVTVTNGLTQFPYPTSVTAPGVTIPYEVTVITTEPHRLSENDLIFVNFGYNLLESTVNYKIRVSSYQVVNYVEPLTSTTLVADILFSSTVIFVNDIDGFSVNDYIKVNDEILKIISIDPNSESFQVERGQLDTKVRLHNASNTVQIYIRPEDFDYKLSVGDTVSSGSAVGTVYALNKEEKSIELRVITGTFTNSSSIVDGSNPGKQITITSVGDKKSYWEIDPSNTGNYFVRDYSAKIYKGSRYIFDLSDISNTGYDLSFSEDSTNINTIDSFPLNGTPGTPGCTLTLNESVVRGLNLDRIYYFEKNNNIVNNKTNFDITTYPFEGEHNVKVIDDYTFKYSIESQLESQTYTDVSYSTNSISSVGKIKTIKNVDGGSGYKQLPLVRGVYHSDLDNAKFVMSISSGVIQSVTVTSGGSRYSNDTVLYVQSSTGTNAILKPTVVNGEITSVLVEDGGSAYRVTDTIFAVDTSADILPVSENIGKIKSVRFIDNGNQISNDRTLTKQFFLYTNILVSSVTGSFFFRTGEFLDDQFGSRFRLRSYRQVGADSYLLKIDLITGEPVLGEVLTGAINGTTAKIEEIKNPTIFGNVAPFIRRKGYHDTDFGKISSSSQKIIDSYYYQDFSYVIQSTKSLSQYKQQVDKSVHPLGFKLFGEVEVESFGDFVGSGLTSSANLPDNYSEFVVIISAPEIKVESTVQRTKYTITKVNQELFRQIDGVGSALLNVGNNDLFSDILSVSTSQFNGTEDKFQLISNSGAEVLDNSGIIVCLNETVQEPYETRLITGISYDGNIATITTNTDHGFAYTNSGITYPVDKYIEISGVQLSPNHPFNFNDKFSIYEVNSSDTFKVLFDNTTNYTSNNDVKACADVQSTVNNLIGIITDAITTPSGTTVQLPDVNVGIWTASGVSTILEANKHRDASNLIMMNRKEIIDRANAKIAVQHPDFYYPNDPQTTITSRFKDSYRLIQLNRQEIIDTSYSEIAIQHPTFVNPNSEKCKRDIGHFIDAISLDVHTGENYYSIEFLKQYFDATGSSLTPNGLSGEVSESITAFNKARDLMKSAITNQLTVKDLTLTPDPITGSNTDPNSCADVQTNIDNLVGIVTFYLDQGSLNLPVPLPAVTSGITASGETKCKRDIGYIIDAVVLDLFVGGNENIIDATKSYFNGNLNALISNGLAGEVPESVTAFNKARDMMNLALNNQLYKKDFTILADYITTSGIISPSEISDAMLFKGQYNYTNSTVSFVDPPKEGSTFYSALYQFLDSADRQRYSYKLKNILFDGTTKEFDLYQSDGSNLITEQDENLLVFLDGVLQYYGENYTIDRTISPNKIIFQTAPESDRNFFAYSFSKYKYLDSINPLIDGSNNTFELFYDASTFKILNPERLLVVLDGIVQRLNESYTISENILTFSETPAENRNCRLLYFYGKSFDKTISIFNGKVYDPLIDIGEVTSEGCEMRTKGLYAKSYIEPGDLIKIDGETPKEIISINADAVKHSDVLEYVSFIFNDNSPVRGQNAVGSAVVSGVEIPGGNTVTISGVVAVSGTTTIDPVFNYQVTGVNILNAGEGYDVAPVVVFKPACGNPGSGAEAEAIVQNGKLVGVNILNPGSGYTQAPEVIFAKRYDIIRQKYPVYDETDRSVLISKKLTPPFYVDSYVEVQRLGNAPVSGHTYPAFVPVVNVINTTIQGVTINNRVEFNLTPSGHTVTTSETSRFINLQIAPAAFADTALITVEKEPVIIIEPPNIESADIELTKEIKLNFDSGVVDDVYDYNNIYTNNPTITNPKLGLRLINLEENKFVEDYGPGSGALTIAALTRYMPDLTIQLVGERYTSVKGNLYEPEFNFGIAAYNEFGVYLASDIDSSEQNIPVSGSTTYLPQNDGYMTFGNEIIKYQSISGSVLLNCTRGALGTTASPHIAGAYLRTE